MRLGGTRFRASMICRASAPPAVLPPAPCRYRLTALRRPPVRRQRTQWRFEPVACAACPDLPRFLHRGSYIGVSTSGFLHRSPQPNPPCSTACSVRCPQRNPPYSTVSAGINGRDARIYGVASEFGGEFVAGGEPSLWLCSSMRRSSARRTDSWSWPESFDNHRLASSSRSRRRQTRAS